MNKINTFLRADWSDIQRMGDIHVINAVDKHWVVITLANLTEYGKGFLEVQTSSCHDVFGELSMIGFSVNWYTMPRGLLRKCNNVFNIDTIARGNFNDLHNCVKLIESDKFRLENVDTDRGSVLYRGSHDMGVIIGEVISYQSMAMAVLNVMDMYHKRLAVHRTMWYKWLKDAEYVEHKTGNLFKFPSGLSVKMDDSDEVLSEDGYRIFCETFDSTDDITRHETEADFLVWLTKYF